MYEREEKEKEKGDGVEHGFKEKTVHVAMCGTTRSSVQPSNTGIAALGLHNSEKTTVSPDRSAQHIVHGSKYAGYK